MTGESVRRLIVVNVVASALLVLAWHTTRLITETPAPTVKIRWDPALGDDERADIEERFQLVHREEIGPDIYNYDLIDSRRDVIRALVEHPGILDTGDLDRSGFAVAATTAAGRARRWLLNRWATRRVERTTSNVIHGWLAVSFLITLRMVKAGSRSLPQLHAAQNQIQSR